MAITPQMTFVKVDGHARCHAVFAIRKLHPRIFMSAYALPRENPGLNQTRAYAKVKRNAPNQPEPSIIINGASIGCKAQRTAVFLL